MRPALIVFWKEVRENLRDRRTVLNTLLTGPLLAPVIFALIINGVVARELDKAERPLPVPVIGGEYAPNLVAALCDRIVVIARGRVVADAPPSALLAETGAPTLEDAFVAVIGSEEGLSA